MMRVTVKNMMAVLIAIAMPGLCQAQQIENEAPPASEAQPQDQQDDATPAAQERTANYRGDNANNEELVHYLAAKLMIMNKCEVAFGKMASQQASSNEVKEYAKKVTDDHRKLNEQLVQAMPGLKSVEAPDFASKNRNEARNRTNAQPRELDRNRAGDAPPTERIGDRSASNATGRGATDRNATTDRQSKGNDAFLDGAAATLIEITCRAAENAHESTTQMLNEKQGQKFDMCFINQQIGAHTMMLAELKAVQDVGSQEFTTIVKQAEKKVEQHLQSAKKIAEKLEMEAGTASGREGAASRPNQPATSNR